MRKLGFQLYRTLLVGGLLAMLLPGAANAQPPLWKRQLGTTADDLIQDVATDTSGSVYVAGSTGGSLAAVNQGFTDAWVTKFNSTGKIQWTRQIGTVGFDFAFGVATDIDGNVYICGATSDDTINVPQASIGAWVAKFNPTGKLLWKRQLGTSGSEYANGVVVDPTGNVYVSASINRTLVGEGETTRRGALVAKFNPTGKLIWKQQLAPTVEDLSNDIAVDATGNIYLSGFKDNFLNPSNFRGDDAWVAKYNPSGKLLWQQQLGTSQRDTAEGVIVDTSGNAYISGSTGDALAGANQGIIDAWLAKYSPAGKLIWKQQLGSSKVDEARSVTLDTFGNAYISGYSDSVIAGANQGRSDAWLAKYSPAGKLVWKQQLGSSGSDYSNSVATDTFGSVYIAGYTYGALFGVNQGERDAWVVKYPQTPPEKLNLRINIPSAQP